MPKLGAIAVACIELYFHFTTVFKFTIFKIIGTGKYTITVLGHLPTYHTCPKI